MDGIESNERKNYKLLIEALRLSASNYEIQSKGKKDITN